MSRTTAGPSQRILVLRVLAAVAMSSMFVGVALLTLDVMLSGFARQRWMIIVGVGCLALFIPLLAVQVNLNRRWGSVVPPVDPGYFGQYPRFSLATAATLTVIAGSTMVTLSLATVIPAYELGDAPARAAALSIAEGPPCGKCSQPVLVEFRTSDGADVVAALAGADGLADGDRPGRALVYALGTRRT